MTQLNKYEIICPIHGPGSWADVSIPNSQRSDDEDAILLCQLQVQTCPKDPSHHLESPARATTSSELFDSSLAFMLWCAECNANVTPKSSICGQTDGTSYTYNRSKGTLRPK